MEDARPIDGEGEAGPELICSRRAGLVALVAWESKAVGEPWADKVIELGNLRSAARQSAAN